MATSVGSVGLGQRGLGPGPAPRRSVGKGQTSARVAGQMLVGAPSPRGPGGAPPLALRGVVTAPDGPDRRASWLCRGPCAPAILCPEECCSVCTKKEVWKVFDIFKSMDRRKTQKVSRQDFFETMKGAEITVDQMRTVRRSCLIQRFRETASEMSLEELLYLIWPKTTQDDLTKMKRWTQMREAQTILRDQNFRGDHADLKRIYNFLDENGDGNLSVRELIRANILKREEIFEIMGSDSMETTMTFPEFCNSVQPHFKQHYVKSHVRSQMEQEEFQGADENWKSQFKNLMKSD